LRAGLHAESLEAAHKHAHAAIRSGSDDAMALALGGFVLAITDRRLETLGIGGLTWHNWHSAFVDVRLFAERRM
jgi:hypothetical protein